MATSSPRLLRSALEECTPHQFKARHPFLSLVAPVIPYFLLLRARDQLHASFKLLDTQ